VKQLHTIKLFTIFCSFIAIVFCSYNGWSQVNVEKKSKTEVERETQLIREEIQRYFGYETLPVRYLSLPYD